MYFTKKATEAEKNYFPGGCGKLYIINTPWIFKMVWAMAKGWVDEKTRARVTICDENHL